MFQPLEKALSDHAPHGIEFNDGKIIVSYNMLMHMEYNKQWGFINNGFGAIDESVECYIARVNVIAQKCSAYMLLHNPIAFCFQEAPTAEIQNKFIESFSSEVKQEYEFRIFSKPKSDNCIMTLYDKKNYTELHELTEQITAIILNEGLNGKILPLVLMNNHSKETILIVNVHATFGQFVINDIKRLFNKAKELGIECTHFIGDFNRDLKKADGFAKTDICDAVVDNKLYLDSKNYLHVNNIDSSSFIRSLKEKLPEGVLPTEKNLNLKVETRDGILSTQEAQLSFIKELYITKNEELAPELNKMPVNFVDNMLIKNEAAEKMVSNLKIAS